MATIIKEGVDPNHTYLGVCNNCGTIFTYKWGDIKDNVVGTWHEHFVECPLCTYESAWSTRPMETIPFECVGSGIFLNELAALIPDGCTAYALYQNGTDILLRQLDTVIPPSMPTLIVGNCSQVTLIPVPNVGETLDTLIRLRVQELDAQNKGSYLKFDETLTPVKISEGAPDIYGIPPTYYKDGEEVAFTEMFRVIDISGEAWENYLTDNEIYRVAQ